MIIDSTEPIGDRRADLRTALIVATVINRHRGEDEKPAEIKDFIFDYWDEDEPEEMSWQEMLAVAELLGGKRPDRSSIEQE